MDLGANQLVVDVLHRSWAKAYLAETAYYWDKNQAGYSNLPYPQMPQGQYDFLQALSPVVKDAGGSGIFYWGGFWSQSSKWLNAPGWTDDDASRRSLFDDNAQATKGIDGLNAPVPANSAPTLQLPPDLTAEATGPDGAHAPFSTTATDVEDATAPTVNCDPAPGTLFPLITTPVNCSATDSAGATTAGSLPLSVWPPLAALLLNLVSSVMLTLYSQEVHRGGDPADLARGLYRPALVVGVLGLAAAVSAAVPFFVLTA